MAEKVGELYYSVELDTGEMVAGQRKVDKELGKTSASVDRFVGKLTVAAAAVAVMAAALAAVKAAKLADEFRLLGARVEITTGSVQAGSVAFGELVAISQRTSTSLAANITLFTRLNTSMLAMGGTQEDTLRLTELVAKAMRVSGLSAQEAASTMRQFGQAMGKGQLNGDELTSLLENSEYLARKLAQGLGVPVGALKDLGEQGKLTSDAIVNALNKAASDIERDFRTVPQTIEAAMQVAQDQAGLAALKFDELSGTSAALTGVTKGLGDVVGQLADQFGAANTEAGTLGRNEAIKGWADKTRYALSYLIDAVDLVWQTVSVLGRNVAYVFTGIGNEIGGIGAQITAVMRGDFAGAKAIGDAMRADADARRKELDAKDAATLGRAKLAGQQMREAWEAGAGGGRGFVNPRAAASTLKPPTPPGKPKGAAFDSAGYLAGLRKDQATEMGVINETEAEKLRIAQKHLTEKKIGEAQYQEAVSLITQTAEQDRAELMRKTQEDINRDRLEADRKAAQERADIERNRLEARQDVAFDNPAEQVRIEEEQRLAAVEAARQQDLANTQLYEEQKIAIQRWAAEERVAIQQREIDMQHRANQASLMAMGDLASNMFMLLQKAGKERTALGKAAFLASKAVAVAEILMNTEVAAAKAMGQTGIFGIGLATMIRASGYASAGMVAGMAIGEVAGGRQYGGPVSSGSLYRVNEGGAPEMFQGSNGSQYMMPTKSGQVVPAGEVGGGGGWTINILNAPPGTTAAVNDQARIIDIAVGRAKAEIAGEISSNTGQVWSALRGGSDLKPRM